MKKLIVRSLSGGTALALALAANQAVAALNVSYDSSQTVSGVDTTVQNGSGSLPYAPSIAGYVLSQVDFSLGASALYNNIYLYNSDIASHTVDQLNTFATVTLLPDGSTATTSASGPITPMVLGAGSYSASPYGDNVTHNATPDVLVITSPSAVADYAYSGAGPTSFSFQTAFQVTTFPGSPVTLALNYPNPGFGTSDAGATFHIEYEYSPVPEASTIGLIAGLGCLVALVRRARC